MKKVLSLAAVLWLVQASCGSAASFLPLGDVEGDPAGVFYSYAWDVSGDGSTVVGRSYSALGDQAFRWTANSGMNGLGFLPGGFSDSSSAHGVSADGSVVVGNSSTGSSNAGSPNSAEAFRWELTDQITGAGTMEGMGALMWAGTTKGWSEVGGVSADGTIVFGQSVFGNSFGSLIRAFRRTPDGTMTLLGNLPGSRPYGTLYHTVVRGASADGETAVGYDSIYWREDTIIDPPKTVKVFKPEAFRWTLGGGMVGLGTLNGQDFSHALGVSADGSTVVGNSSSLGQSQAFHWTAADGMIGLGDPSDYSYAYDVSGDGLIVVGQKKRGSNNLAFIWDADNDVRYLKDVLIDGGLDAELEGWTLISARGISDDGSVIVGYGRNPDGRMEAYVADLSGKFQAVPEPSTLVLAAIAFASLAAYAWRKRRKS